MVLHRANFEIPAKFSFQPYSAKWTYASAQILEWVEGQTIGRMSSKPSEDPEKNWLRVRIGDLPSWGLGALYGTDSSPCYTVQMDRATIPPEVLLAHENHRNTPDVTDRRFTVLICRKPEIRDGLWALQPGKITKDAWSMRDEFMNLEADQDPELGWDWSIEHFLNRWGIWEASKGYTEEWAANPSGRSISLRALMTEQTPDKPDFLMVVPHLLKQQQEKYRKALLQKSRLSWLRSHRLEHETADNYPFIRVRRSYCNAAIEATITIDHIEGLKFGICERCHKIFEKETEHEKRFCSRSCITAAGVKRWRDKQRAVSRKGKNRNAKG